jgi:hypothetical protein
MFASNASKFFKHAVNISGHECLKNFHINVLLLKKQKYEYIACFGMEGTKHEMRAFRRLLKEQLSTFNNYEMSQLETKHDSHMFKEFLNKKSPIKINILQIFRCK